MSATVNKLVYGDLTFTDDEIQDGEVYDAVALLSDALEIGTINVGQGQQRRLHRAAR